MTRPRLKRDWVGLEVRSLVELQSGRFGIPAGTYFRVMRNWSGLWLQGAECGHCGVKIYITRVPESSVEILPSRCSCNPTDAVCPHGQADRPRF